MPCPKEEKSLEKAWSKFLGLSHLPSTGPVRYTCTCTQVPGHEGSVEEDCC